MTMMTMRLAQLVMLCKINTSFYAHASLAKITRCIFGPVRHQLYVPVIVHCARSISHALLVQKLARAQVFLCQADHKRIK